MNSKRRIKVSISGKGNFQIKQDGDYFVATALDMDISSFGKTRSEAINSLGEALNSFVQHLIETNQLNLLVESGWKVNINAEKVHLVPPIEIVEKIPFAEIFSDTEMEVESSDYKKLTTAQ